jgi:two-component system cell cycle response regulator
MASEETSLEAVGAGYGDERTVADTLCDAHDTEEVPLPSLVILSGIDAGQIHLLGLGEHVLGRAPRVGICVEDESVSRRHAAILVRPETGPTLRDLRSTNGTRLNGEPVGTKPRPLCDGDKIRLSHDVVLKFTWQLPVEEALHRNLYRSAVVDGLTGVYNKRYLLDRLPQEYAHAERHDRPLTLAVIDLDHFKRVNDSLGHDAGDRVLKAVAGCLQTQVRQDDILARFGGEEFVVLMRDTGLVKGLAVGDRIRAHLATLPIRLGGQLVRITASIGVASLADPGVHSAMDLFLQADSHLYEAKHSGRNQVRPRVELGRLAARAAPDET